jgi:hypothetical protein
VLREESIGEQHEAEMMMQAAPGAAFVVVHAEAVSDR